MPNNFMLPPFGGISAYSYYLNLLGKWPTGLALASQWLIYFDFTSVNSLMGNLQGILRDRETIDQWNLNSNVTQYLLDGSLQYAGNNIMGCAFARQVSLPGETIDAGNKGLDYGGFQAPATASNRENYKKLGVTMLETNASFLDLVLRPWIISVGYNGLVARPTNSPLYVKSNFVDVVMLAKTGRMNDFYAAAPSNSYSNIAAPMGIRKIYRFYNVAPVNMPGEEYSYMEEGLRTSNVEFVYDSYAVQDAGTSLYIGLQ